MRENAWPLTSLDFLLLAGSARWQNETGIGLGSRQHAGSLASRCGREPTRNLNRKPVEAESILGSASQVGRSLGSGPSLKSRSLRSTAVSESPTSNGPADYTLIVDEPIVAIIEAKKFSRWARACSRRAERYARGLSKGRPLKASSVRSMMYMLRDAASLDDEHLTPVARRMGLNGDNSAALALRSRRAPVAHPCAVRDAVRPRADRARRKPAIRTDRIKAI
jgi:hypothetical protein